MTVAAVYLRVSSDRQDEANQEPECLALCAARGWEPRTFRETMSGAKSRPVWDAALDTIRRGQCRALVVWAVDRAGRSKVQLAHDLGQVWRWGAEVASVRDSWLEQPAGPLRTLLVDVMGWMAEGERARLIERTRAGLDRARAVLAARGSYVRARDGKVVRGLGRPRTLPLEVIGRASELRGDGPAPAMSWGRIARVLNDEGLGVYNRTTIERAVAKMRIGEGR